MTLDKLIKRLQALREECGGRVSVAMHAREAIESCNGVFQILDVNGAYADVTTMCDGDGFTIINKDGSERIRTTIVLSVYDKSTPDPVDIGPENERT